MHDRSSAGAVDQSAVSMRAAGMEDTAAVVEGQLEAELTAMSLDDALCLARAFSHYLNLMGIAETHHRYHIVHAETHVPYVDFDAVLHSQCVFMYLIHCKHGHALNLYNYTLHKLTRKLLQISVWDLMFSPINRLYLFIVYL